MKIVVDPHGTINFIYDDALLFLRNIGEMSTRRAGFVEPDEQGNWKADLSPSGGPLLGGFTTRSEALAAEVAWLNWRYGYVS
jgi:hypothetical protein